MESKNKIRMEIADGRERFYQWDSGQRLIIYNGEHCNEVHFTNSGRDYALVCRIWEKDGARFVDVPNVLLQSAKTISAYAYTSAAHVKLSNHYQTFEVMKRNQPENYVYTETEVRSYEKLEERITALESTDGVNPEAIETGVQRYMEENPISAESIGALSAERLPEAVNDALAQAKASGEFKGEKGETGETGPQGEQGIRGETGPKGDKGDKGDIGATGPQGPKGDTGATGPAGADGKSPVKGVDYFTEADKSEIAAQIDGATLVQAPTYVDAEDKMTDTSRVYVLAKTGHIWAYMDTTRVEEVTKTDTITATDENPYKDANRLGSSEDAYSGQAGYHVTPLIDLTKYAGKTIRIHLEGCQYSATGAYANYIQCRIYGVDKSVLAPRPWMCDVDDGSISNTIGFITNGITVTYNSDTSTAVTIECPAGYASVNTEIGYIRFCGKGAVADSKISITYQAVETVTGGHWVDTGTTYAPTLTEADKQAMAEEIADMVDVQLLSVIGDGVVTV